MDDNWFLTNSCNYIYIYIYMYTYIFYNEYMYIMHTIYLQRVRLMLIYIPKICHGLCSLISLHLSPSYMLMIVCMYFSVINMYIQIIIADLIITLEFAPTLRALALMRTLWVKGKFAEENLSKYKYVIFRSINCLDIFNILLGYYWDIIQILLRYYSDIIEILFIYYLFKYL